MNPVATTIDDVGQQRRPFDRVEAANQPARDREGLRHARQSVHEQDECRADAVDCDTGEQQAGRRELAATGRGAHHDEQNHASSGESSCPDSHDAGDHVPVERDGEDGAERGPGRDAERVRRRKRIAQHRLKQAAGQRQRAAREKTEQCSRQTEIRQNRPVGLLTLPDTPPVEQRLGPTNGRSRAAAANSSADPPIHATTDRRLISITDTGPRDASRRVRRSVASRTRAAMRDLRAPSR